MDARRVRPPYVLSPRWGRIFEPEAMAAHGDDVLMVGVEFCQSFTEASHKGVNGLFRDAFAMRFWPNSLYDLFSADHGPLGLNQTSQQTILGDRKRRIEEIACDSHRASRVI